MEWVLERDQGKAKKCTGCTYVDPSSISQSTGIFGENPEGWKFVGFGIIPIVLVAVLFVALTLIASLCGSDVG
jgi:hypothetical protein